MNAKERIEIIERVTAEGGASLFEACKKFEKEGYIGYSFEEKRAYYRKPLREVIRKRMEEEGISQRRLARVIGLHQQAMNEFLRGKRGIPFDKLEEILSIFDII